MRAINQYGSRVLLEDCREFRLTRLQVHTLSLGTGKIARYRDQDMFVLGVRWCGRRPSTRPSDRHPY